MLIIDEREPDEYKKRADKTMLLAKGDAWILKEGRIVKVERKTISDLYNSLTSDRLNSQLKGIDELILIVDDSWLPRSVFDLLFSDGKLRRIVNGISRHTPVEFCTSVDDYFHTLRVIEKHLAEGTYGVLRVKKSIDIESNEVSMIACIPSIGVETAKKIIEYYKTPFNSILNAYKWDEDIEGIGKKRCERAMKFLMGERGER